MSVVHDSGVPGAEEYISGAPAFGLDGLRRG